MADYRNPDTRGPRYSSYGTGYSRNNGVYTREDRSRDSQSGEGGRDGYEGRSYGGDGYSRGYSRDSYSRDSYGRDNYNRGYNRDRDGGDGQRQHRFEIRTAVLVDGSYFRRRSMALWGSKPPAARARELREYCWKHLIDRNEYRRLCRVFYYDCPPVGKNVYNPLTQEQVDLSRSSSCAWMSSFLEELKHQRKFSLRLGAINENTVSYQLNQLTLRQLLAGERDADSVTMDDLELRTEQKGVEMRIGTDIAALALKHQVDQIILITGDCDFIPAAELARSEGIDFILDPMRGQVKDEFYGHIDGVRSPAFQNYRYADDVQDDEEDDDDFPDDDDEDEDEEDENGAEPEEGCGRDGKEPSDY